MLVIVNGMYKTGSTWVYTMLRELFNQSSVKEEWRDDNFASNIDLLKDPDGILKAASVQNIVIKTHTFEQLYLDFLVKNDAKIIVTNRPLDQIVLSHYYHFSNEKIRLPFVIYASTVGLAKCFESALYEYYATKQANCHIMIDYNRLKSEPAAVLSEICEEIGMEITFEALDRIVNKANMKGRDFSAKFPEKTGQDWFFKRNSNDTTSLQMIVAKWLALFSTRAIKIAPIRLCLNKIAMCFESRSRFQRSSLSKRAT